MASTVRRRPQIAVRLLRIIALSIALPSGNGAPIRPRLSQPLPPLPASISRLYAYGGSKRLRELTLDGIRATDLVCWAHVKQRPCDCEGTKAHLFAGACGRHISGSFGASDGCRRGGARCSQPHPEGVSATLTAWYAERHGVPVQSAVAPLMGPHNTTSRSASTATLGTGAAAHCTVPPSQVLERLRRHATSSTHVAQLVEADFLADMLAQPASRRLLTQRGALKEISEAYAAAASVRRLCAELHLPEAAARCGRGVTLLDVCSGKGVGAHLLSRILPESQVVMLDNNADMDLSHVCHRPNLQFVELDLFSREAGSVLRALGAGARAGDDDAERGCCIAVGMHLCGALSPRLLALASHVDSIDAFAVCPCCLKGSIGDHVKRVARSSGVPNYDVLLETLRALCERELEDRGVVWVERDVEMITPRDGLVSAVKTSSPHRE